MDFIITYKWLILLSFETFAWLATIYMFYARYWLESQTQFLVSLVLAGITGYLPHILLGVLDYLTSGKMSFFIIFIFTILILGATIGKRYIIKVDKFLYILATKKRNSKTNSQYH